MKTKKNIKLLCLCNKIFNKITTPHILLSQWQIIYLCKVIDHKTSTKITIKFTRCRKKSVKNKVLKSSTKFQYVCFCYLLPIIRKIRQFVWCYISIYIKKNSSFLTKANNFLTVFSILVLFRAYCQNKYLNVSNESIWIEYFFQSGT